MGLESWRSGTQCPKGRKSADTGLSFLQPPATGRILDLQEAMFNKINKFSSIFFCFLP